jgi:hypothetical protein
MIIRKPGGQRDAVLSNDAQMLRRENLEGQF